MKGGSIFLNPVTGDRYTLFFCINIIHVKWIIIAIDYIIILINEIKRIGMRSFKVKIVCSDTTFQPNKPKSGTSAIRDWTIKISGCYAMKIGHSYVFFLQQRISSNYASYFLNVTFK
jgi:hypothetical protein